MMPNARRRRPALEVLESRALLSAGGPDTTFGGTGTITTSVSTFNLSADDGQASGVAVQPDLKTVVVGPVSQNVPQKGYKNGVNENFNEVVRYNADGSLDTTFGSGGAVTLPGPSNFPTSGYTAGPDLVALQSNGQIVVAGIVGVTQGTGKNQTTTAELSVYRLNANGSLDTTFNSTGQVTLGYIPGSVGEATGLAIQPDGKIVVGANDDANGGFVVARLNANGTRDTSFGPNGQGYADRHLAAGTVTPYSSSLVLDAAGNILVGGVDDNPAVGTSTPAVIRYTPAGLPDPTFGTNGEALLDPPGSSQTSGIPVAGIGLQSTGQIVVSGLFGANRTGGVARLNANGTLDPTFGSGGYFIDSTLWNPVALTVQPNDEILVAGGVMNGSNAVNAFAVDRITAGGQADATFGSGSQAQATFNGSAGTQARAIALGPDGKITVAGGATFNVTATSSVNRFAVVRLLNDITSNTVATVAAPSTATTAPVPTGVSSVAATTNLAPAQLPNAVTPIVTPLVPEGPDLQDAFIPLLKRRGSH